MIEDLTEGTTPFTIEGGARDSSIYVDREGDVGLGTSVPFGNLHIVEKFGPPTITLEGALSAWGVAADAIGTPTFGIADFSTGRVPFFIESGAEGGSLLVDADGNVSGGPRLPARRLHVRGDRDGSVRLRVAPAPAGARR